MPARSSPGRSRRLFVTRIAQARAPTATAASTVTPSESAGLGVGGAEHGDEPEEHEDEQLAEPGVSVRPGPAGVEPGGHDGRRAHRQQPPAAAQGDQGQARDGGDAERQEGRRPDRRGPRQPRTGEPQRAHPVGVGAADAVGVVVGVVDPHLQCEGDQQGQQGPQRAQALEHGRGPGPHQNGRDRRGQGARSGTGPPLGGGGPGSGAGRSGAAHAGTLRDVEGQLHHGLAVGLARAAHR